MRPSTSGGCLKAPRGSNTEGSSKPRKSWTNPGPTFEAKLVLWILLKEISLFFLGDILGLRCQE